ncbi:MAG: VWA domain-containing protein [Gammaproteobacteria bacterium]
MADKQKGLIGDGRRPEVDAFLRAVASTPALTSFTTPGRLIFAMDATASREPSWNQACHIQTQMFQETAAIGGLEIQLCYYRGYGEFHSLPWLSDSKHLLREMTAVYCLGGHTQIEKVLKQTIEESRRKKVAALVFVGDRMEEDVDRLCQSAGELGLMGVPAFLFQEGTDPVTERAFKQMARITQGAYCPFDINSAKLLRDLLSAVAVYAAGGRRALADFGNRKNAAVQQLVQQINRP